MSDNSDESIRIHTLKQSTRDSDERTILRHTGSEGVRLSTLVDTHLRHRNTCLAREITYRAIDEGFFSCKGKGFLFGDRRYAIRSFRHPSGHRERDECSEKSDDECVETNRNKIIPIQIDPEDLIHYPHDYTDEGNDEEIRHDKETDTFEELHIEDMRNNEAMISRIILFSRGEIDVIIF